MQRAIQTFPNLTTCSIFGQVRTIYGRNLYLMYVHMYFVYPKNTQSHPKLGRQWSGTWMHAYVYGAQAYIHKRNILPLRLLRSVGCCENNCYVYFLNQLSSWGIISGLSELRRRMHID